MLGRWDPFAELSRLQDEVFRGRRNPSRAEHARFQPAVDIWEGKDAIVLKAELPGVKADDVSISVENNIVTLKGERAFTKDENVDGYHRVENTYGSFSRSFALPNSAATEAIDATLESGVLTLTIPKRVEAQPRKIAIGVGKKVVEPKTEKTHEARPSVS